MPSPWGNLDYDELAKSFKALQDAINKICVIDEELCKVKNNEPNRSPPPNQNHTDSNIEKRKEYDEGHKPHESHEQHKGEEHHEGHEKNKGDEYGDDHEHSNGGEHRQSHEQNKSDHHKGSNRREGHGPHEL